MAGRSGKRIGPADLHITLTARSNKQVFRWLVACEMGSAWDL